jgi:RNA polymerase sigma-70 factor (ECF subfamily)
MHHDEEFEVLRKRVSAAVMRHCPSWLGEQAEDIVQNVLVKLLKTLNKSEGNQKFSAVYLKKSVYSSVVDEIRRACRRKEDAVEDVGAVEPAPSIRTDPDRQSASLDISRGIVDCLKRLVRMRRVAVTFYLQGCSVPETARLMRWSSKKAENLVYRGLADLRNCLTRKGLAP